MTAATQDDAAHWEQLYRRLARVSVAQDNMERAVRVYLDDPQASRFALELTWRQVQEARR